MIKSNTKNYFIAILFIMAAQLSFSQSWVELMKDPNSNFFDVQAAFNKEWTGKPYVKGKGHKQFKRWEYFMRDRILPDGSYPQLYKPELKDLKMKLTTPTLAKGSGYGDWQALGPFVNGSAGPETPGSGRLNVIVTDPNDVNTIYVGAPSGGVWKTTDAGSNWTPLSDQLSSIGISGIAVDYNNSDIIYLATGDRDAGDTYSIGVMKSTDGGLTWVEAGNITSETNDILIDPTNSSVVWIATSTGIFKSTNSGGAWTNVRTGNFMDIEFKPGDSQTVYGVTGSGFYKTTNASTFTNITSGLPTGSGRLAIAVTPANDTYVYILAADGNYDYTGVYRSTDSGTTFTAKNTTTDVFDGVSQAWYDMAIGVSDTDPEMVFTGVLNIWKSTNGGTSFTQVNDWSNENTKYTHADIHYLGYHSGKFYAGTDGGIYVSTNNASSFTDKSNGLQIGQFYKIGGSQANSTRVLGGLQDNGGMTFNGTNWLAWHGGDGMEAQIDPTNVNKIYGMSQYGDLSYSSNGGTSLSVWYDNPGETGLWVTPMQIDQNNGRIVAGYDNLWEYTVAGGWNQLSSWNFPASIRNIELYDSNSDYMYISTDNNKIYKTLDNGVTITNITTGTGFPTLSAGQNLTSIEVNPDDFNQVWITFSGFSSTKHVYYSANAGTTWTNLSTGLANFPCNMVKYDRGSNGGIYVGTDVGVYYRDNDLNAWIEFSQNLPNVIVNDLEINEAAGVIKAGTYGRGIWQSALYTGNVDCSLFNITATVTQPSCLNNNGSISVSTSGGIPTYVYAWSNGATVAPLTGLAAGTYTVTVTDGNACTTIATATLTLPTSPTATVTSTSSSCGVSNGTCNVTASGGTTPYSYLWSNAVGTSANNNVSAGTYTVTVTDNKSCTVVKSVTVSGANAPSVSVTSTTATCGNSNGTTTSTVTGGATPYSYSWSNSSSGTSLSSLGAGVYTLTLTDNSSCSIVKSVTVSGTSSPTINASTTEEICGQSNGTASASVSSGTSPYSYSWSNGGTTSSLSSLAAATYSLTVSDNNGCSSSTSVTVGTISGPSITVTSTNETCSNDNGNVSLVVVGGISPYTYSWSNGETESSIDSLSEGTFGITLSDANMCSASGVVTINDLTSPVLDYSTTDADCGLANGSITTTVSGGSTPFTYKWNTLATTSSLGAVTQGIYTVTITDANSCKDIETIIVNPSSGLEVMISVTIPISCHNSSDGKLKAIGSGGSSPYTYFWSGGLSGINVPNLSAGVYTVTVLDNAGCFAYETIDFSAPSELLATLNTTDDLCGTGSGEISVSVIGGTEPYSYLWSSTETESTITELATGTYSVTITDSHSCTFVDEASIISSTEMTISETLTPANCLQNDGGIMLSVNGGESPYSYGWSNSSTGAFNSNISSGVYGVTVSDANGCEKQQSYILNETNSMTYSMSAVSSTNCYGSIDGAASVDVSGGVSPYSYAWDNGQTEQDATSLSSGEHIVEVTDGAGCVLFGLVTISEPDSISMYFSSTPTNSLCQGGASVSANGGTAPYSYLWSNGVGIESISNVCVGTYALTLTDVNNCKKTGSVEVLHNGISTIDELGQQQVDIFPNPTENNFTVSLSSLDENNIVELKLYSITGQLVYEEKGRSHQGNYTTQIGMEKMDSGIYLLNIKSGENFNETHRIIKK